MVRLKLKICLDSMPRRRLTNIAKTTRYFPNFLPKYYTIYVICIFEFLDWCSIIYVVFPPLNLPYHQALIWSMQSLCYFIFWSEEEIIFFHDIIFFVSFLLWLIVLSILCWGLSIVWLRIEIQHHWSWDLLFDFLTVLFDSF